ncbi:hypothetical protein [Microbulbifer halophilus]|uniref:Lipoprotein n=1 Tax=Microbulbifer halophilus TaxID=453963 RepID=A0ABW5EHU7_9GAMM|nr:hypothetical protein [Microbulbifer halophilus]MCW8127662.1 hypothetical protein [Microbulbifer halophilus]
MRTAIPLLAALFISACSHIETAQQVTVSGTVIEEAGKYYLQDADARYHLNPMPQLQYRRYLDRELVIRGEVPTECAQAWQDAVVRVGDEGSVVDWEKVDWSPCLAPHKVNLVTADGRELVYDWEKIDLEDYYF